MPLEALCIELRPNLCSGQMFLQFDKPIRDTLKTHLVIKERDLHIVEDGHVSGRSQLVLRHDSFGMDIEHITIFSASMHHISYHFNYKHIDLDALHKAGGRGMLVERRPMLLSFAERTDMVALHCSKCQYELVPGCKYNRLREFPTGMIEFSEFFCHNHRISHGSTMAPKPPTLVPGPTDLYYGINHIVINMAVLHCRVTISSEHIYCKRCTWMIGQTILKGAAGKLWADALRWLSPDVSNNNNIAQLQVPRHIFQYPSVTQQFLRILSNLWSESLPQFALGNSRALLIATMPNRHQHFMLIQVLDPQLSVLRCNPNELNTNLKTNDIETHQLRFYRACKLYYRVSGTCQQEAPMLQEWQQQMQVPKFAISPYLFLELQQRLKTNAQLIPHAWRFNTAEEKLVLTYFFYETEKEELQTQQKEQQAKPIQNNLNMQSFKQMPKQQLDQKKYKTGARLAARLHKEEDELSDSDNEARSQLLLKNALIIGYEQNLAKRWGQKKQEKQLNLSKSTDPTN